MPKKNKQDSGKKNAEPAKVKLFKNPLKTVETTIISSGSRLEGSIETEGTLIVKCGSLEILKDGHLDAKVEAEDVSVAGSFEGEMICNGRLTVCNSGKVIGDISYGTLSIESGGILDGSVAKSNPEGTAVVPLYQESN